MKSCISVFIALLAANCFMMEVSSKWHSRKTLTFTKFKRFSWETCGKPDAPTQVKTLHFYPNLIPSPGYALATASVTTSVDLLSPLPVNVTLEREVDDVWVKIPCVNDLGSCYYPDACDQLAQVLMMSSFCPHSLHPSSSCGCPLKAGGYDWPTSGIYIPNFSLSNKVTNFRLHIILGNSEKELGCFKVNFSLASALNYLHKEL